MNFMTLTRHIRAICILAVIAVCAFAPGQSLAQSPELGAAFKEYQKLNKQGKYAEAVPFAEKVVELAKRDYGPGHPSTATSLGNLAGLYETQGRYAEAVSSFRQVVQLSPEDQEAHQALALAMGQVENSISALDESAGES